MKKLLSILLAVITIISSLSFTSTVFAGTVKYSSQKKQSNSFSHCAFNFSDKYYVKTRWNNVLYVYNKKGGTLKKKIVCKDMYSEYDEEVQPIMNLFVYGDYIYYNCTAQNSIRRVKVDGTNNKTIAKDSKGEQIVYFAVYDNKVIYRTSDEGLFVTTTTGKNKKQISYREYREYMETVYADGRFFCYDGKVYYVRDGKLIAYNLKTGKKTSKTPKGKTLNNYDVINMFGENLYLLKHDKGALYGNYIYKLNVSTMKLTKLVETKTEYSSSDLLIYNKDNMYANFNDTLYKITSTGGKKKLASNANHIGVYKNSLVALIDHSKHDTIRKIS